MSVGQDLFPITTLSRACLRVELFSSINLESSIPSEVKRGQATFSGDCGGEMDEYKTKDQTYNWKVKGDRLVILVILVGRWMK